MRKLLFKGFSNKGFEGQIIGIETDIRNGFPGFDIIGLPDNAIKEARERIKTSLRNSGFKFPQSHVLVSLSPASVPKSGSLLDLPIALSIVFASSSKFEFSGPPVTVMAAGELSLTGEVINDFSAMGVVDCAKRNGCNVSFVPFEYGKGANVFHVSTLTEAFLKCGELQNEDVPGFEEFYGSDNAISDNAISDDPLSISGDGPFDEEPFGGRPAFSLFNGMIGMLHEKNALLVSAAGWHSILLFGPPGVGKTSLSNCLVNLLENPQGKLLDEVRHIYGCIGVELKEPVKAPCRTVPHDCSMAQFTGGRSLKSPGEGALSHCGVLILDELDSYSKKLTDSVRESYDKGLTFSSRSGETTVYPASFLLCANMNVCPCGGLGNPDSVCTCTSQKIASYWNRVGSPLIERFDICLPVKQPNLIGISQDVDFEDAFYLERLRVARARQKLRYKGISRIEFNGQLHLISGSLADFLPKEVELFAGMESASRTNFRFFNSVVTLARTIADLDDRENVSEKDIEMALEYKKYGNGDYYWKEIK